MPDLQELLAQKRAFINLMWDEARRLASVLKAQGVLEVYVFGSLAKGGAYLDSDLDLLAVVETELPPVGRGVALRQAMAKEKPRFPIDLLVFTPAEINSPEKSRSLERLLAEGVKL